MGRRIRHLNPGSAGAVLALDSRFISGLNDGDAVTTWDDRSNSNNDATQSTSVSRPTYETNEQGGNPCIRFDGVNDFLSYGTSVFGYTGDATVMAVIKATGAANEYGSVISEFSSYVTGTSIACQMTVFPNNAVEPCTDVYGPGGVRYNSTLTNSTWQIVAWSWSNWSTHKTNGNTRLAVGGLETSGATYGINPGTFSPAIRSIGRFDTNNTNDNHLAADIGLICKLPECSQPMRKRLYHAAAYSFKIACS